MNWLIINIILCVFLMNDSKADLFIKENKNLITGGSKEMDISIYVNTKPTPNEVRLVINGPDDAWFGVGFDADTLVMQGTYAIICDYNSTTMSTDVYEVQLGDHNPGNRTDQNITEWSEDISNGIRTVTVVRPRIGGLYSFPGDIVTKIKMIAAQGTSGDYFSGVPHNATRNHGYNKKSTFLHELITTSAPTSDPTPDPTLEPTWMPTDFPTTDPTERPTTNPTEEPTMDPTQEPTSDPTDEPTTEPTVDPTEDPTEEPTLEPTMDPTEEPTIDPTEEPTMDPTIDPTEEPTMEPTGDPTSDPTIDPTAEPTFEPTLEPTDPTRDPTMDPTQEPTSDPTNEPTSTRAPTNEPTTEPTFEPTFEPSIDPTIEPTSEPTMDPTMDPTTDPTMDPTTDPTTDPTFEPTNEPTTDPTMDPTTDPTFDPTFDPTMDPTEEPTMDPTTDPTWDPTFEPTTEPTLDPTMDPTTPDPTEEPTWYPTLVPTMEPTDNGNNYTHFPTDDPSTSPTMEPSIQPTKSPTYDISGGSNTAGKQIFTVDVDGCNEDDVNDLPSFWKQLAADALDVDINVVTITIVRTRDISRLNNGNDSVRIKYKIIYFDAEVANTGEKSLRDGSFDEEFKEELAEFDGGRCTYDEEVDYGPVRIISRSSALDKNERSFGDKMESFYILLGLVLMFIGAVWLPFLNAKTPAQSPNYLAGVNGGGGGGAGGKQVEMEMIPATSAASAASATTAGSSAAPEPANTSDPQEDNAEIEKQKTNTEVLQDAWNDDDKDAETAL